MENLAAIFLKVPTAHSELQTELPRQQADGKDDDGNKCKNDKL